MSRTGKSRHVISKSSFLKGLQCLKSLYLYKYHYNLRDPITKERQALFQHGHNVGKLAWKLFPGGLDLTTDNFDFTKMFNKTAAAIHNNTEVLYEAVFKNEGVLAIADIITREKGGYNIFEVKSSSRVSATHIRDAALQYFVIKNSGITIQDISIVHVTDKTELDKETPEVTKLFNIQSVKDEVLHMQPYIEEKLAEQKLVLGMRRLPIVKTGSHCLEPYKCDFHSYCHKVKVVDGALF